MAKVIEVKQSQPIQSVTLELTGDEADFLYCLLYRSVVMPYYTKPSYNNSLLRSFEELKMEGSYKFKGPAIQVEE